MFQKRNRMEGAYGVPNNLTVSIDSGSTPFPVQRTFLLSYLGLSTE